MIAILLFSGKSTRFWPIREKSLFPVFGTSLLEMQTAKLKAAGFKEIILVAGAHNLKEAKKIFPSMTFVTQSPNEPGMRGAMLAVLPRCKKESVMIVSANDVIDERAFKELRMKGVDKKEGGLILARKVKTYFPGGYLETKGKRILSIIEKPGAGNEPSSLVNIVAHVHSDASVLLKAVKEIGSQKDDAYEQALDSLFNQFHYEAVPYTGPWQAVKYPWHLLDLLPHMAPELSMPVIHPTASIHKTAVIEGAVRIERGVRVFAHATIMGPCFIGEDSIVANNALVRGSSVGKRCVVGYNTEIARSILADDVWTHSSYVGDSVIGNGTSLAAGTVTGNLRLDEEMIHSDIQGELTPTHRTKFGTIIGEHCRTGIHTGIAPGVKIGAHSFINSGSMVTSDVPDSSFVKDGIVRPNKKAATPPPDRSRMKGGIQGKSR